MADRCPNAIFLMTDQHRFDAFGYTGGHVQTDAFDELFRDGAFFHHAFSSMPLCIPARACMFTGNYSHTTGITTNEEAPCVRADRLYTMGDRFRDAGYRTSLCGKNRLYSDEGLPNGGGRRSLRAAVRIR